MDELYINQLDEVFKPNHEPTEEGYFTEEDYQELQRNLVLYKEGSQEAENRWRISYGCTG